MTTRGLLKFIVAVAFGTFVSVVGMIWLMGGTEGLILLMDLLLNSGPFIP